MNGLLYSSQASVSRTAAISLESDQPWVKGWTVLGYATKWVPLGPADSEAPGRPSPATSRRGHPEEVGPSGLEELCKVIWSPGLPVAGFLPPDFILGAAWLKDDSTFGRAELKSLGFVQIAGEEWWARSNNTQALGSLFWHIPLWFTTQDTIFSDAGAPITRERERRGAAASWPFPGTTTLKIGQGLSKFTRPLVLWMSPALKK